MLHLLGKKFNHNTAPYSLQRPKEGITVCRHSNLRQTTRMLQLSENSMQYKKTIGQLKTHGCPQGHPTIQLLKYIGKTEETIQQEKPIEKPPQTWEKLKELWIKKLHADIDSSIDKMVSCHIPMATLRADVEKCKGGNNKLY